MPRMNAKEFTRWRKMMKFSVAQAAEALGVVRQTVYTWERGEVAVPKAVELACAAIVMGVSDYPRVGVLQPKPEGSDESESIGALAAPFSGAPGMPSS
jgi:transcriptional regulator with XRE-family HTH domain